MNKLNTKRSVIILFSLRLFFYLSVLVLLTIHPGIAISFDRIGIMQWFVIVPVLAVIAFLPIKGRGVRYQGMGNQDFPNIDPCPKKLIISGITLLMLSFMAGGFRITAIWPFLAGVISFMLTFLLFNCSAAYGARWGKLSLLEPFFLIWICLRLLALSRSGEEIAGQSASLTQFILVWSAVVFLLHSVVVYFCLFPQSKKGAGKEAIIFLTSAAAALVLVLAVLPPDFIRNTIVENLNNDRAPELINEGSDRGMPQGGRQGRRQRDENGRQPELRGINEYEWQSRTGRGRREGSSEDNRQYMVKIVASVTEPVYMGDSFRGTLDPEKGFLASEEEPLNDLLQQRLFITWRNPENNFDADRERLEIYSLSTLSQKYLPYWVFTVDPVILSENSGPLKYIHQAVSDIHAGNPLSLIYTPLRQLNRREEQALALYKEIPLKNEDLHVFDAWLVNARQKWQSDRNLFLSGNSDNAEAPEPVNEYLEDILAILTGFSEYQYNLSYNEDSSVESIKNFLFETKDGDCVEFSNSAALLARFAGIPSRVVTGYLVAEELQTEAHLRGLANLRRQIPFLQQFPFDNLYMVTNLHAHSWVQFYIPDYGWLDFEATGFAIPPVGTGDFNTWDVVIPILDNKKTFTNLRKFPWRAVLRTAGWMALAAFVGAYALRYGREAVLFARARNGGRDGVRALYLLLLAKLAADGKPIKPASKTASEYSELFNLTQRTQRNAEDNNSEDHLRSFAFSYSQLRWREFESNEERNECFNNLMKEYRSIIISTRRGGLGWALVRILSLRGLAYL